jgi:DNA modification methylase
MVILDTSAVIHKDRPVTLSEWLEGRAPNHLSTNAGTPLVAFQAWRSFKEAFAPELIAQAFEETSRSLGRKVRRSVDPFGGSGTTALASQFLGADPTTVEVNPYLADLIEAKLATYNTEALLDDYRDLLAAIGDFEGDEVFPGAPETFVEPGRNGRFLFSEPVARRIAGIKQAIDRIENLDHRRLFRVLLAPVAVAASNVVISGKGRRYKLGWETKQARPEQIVPSFDDAFVQAVYDIQRYKNREFLGYQLLRGDARQLTPTVGEFDVAIFSPPYPNSFDYTDVYNVELWVCGYLTNGNDNRQLRLRTLRSHVQIKRDYAAGSIASPTLEVVQRDLYSVKDQLWNVNIPGMVSAYFADMQEILRRLRTSLVQGGRAYLVVGDSRYEGVQIPVADILSEIAADIGFRKLGVEPFRSMRASPQQGGKPGLLETLLTLELD